jgi:hypothetical protein
VPHVQTAAPLVVTYALVAQVRLQLGPTPLVFVPMLFLLPPLTVPALVTAGGVLGELPAIARRPAGAPYAATRGRA